LAEISADTEHVEQPLVLLERKGWPLEASGSGLVMSWSHLVVAAAVAVPAAAPDAAGFGVPATLGRS
jgi:hypothetical protein